MFYKGFTVTAVANVTTLDDGLVSEVDNPVHVRAVLVNVATHEGNILEAWIGTKRVLEIYDYVLDTQEESAADTPPFSTTKIIRLPVELNVPPGQIFKIGMRCGAAGVVLTGAYEYDEKE